MEIMCIYSVFNIFVCKTKYTYSFIFILNLTLNLRVCVFMCKRVQNIRVFHVISTLYNCIILITINLYRLVEFNNTEITENIIIQKMLIKI